MSIWSRFANVFRGRVDEEIDAEIQSHFDDAQFEGREAAEAARAFGSRLRAREAIRDVIVNPWLESIVRDAVFGWRQILKHKTASVAAVLSLALGIGACVASFRLIDALFLRPLPIAHPERLYALTFQNLSEGKIETGDQFDYPGFRQLRAAVKDQAALMAISFVGRVDLTFGSDDEMERAWRQYVSGRIFSEFGLKPALGRLLSANDDITPGADPYAVISYEYWSRRFAKDPGVIGRRFRIANDFFEIIGVAPEGFTGTEPGAFTDIFLPNMMNLSSIEKSRMWSGYGVFAIVPPGAKLDQIRERLSAALHAYREETTKSWWPAERLQAEKDFFVAAPVSLEAASSGRSGTQIYGYRRLLTIFAVLVGLVLLIASVNVANLMTARAAARSREMALRVSIGAGRARLIQLVLMESALVAIAASALGLAFSWWAAPFVVSKLNPSVHLERYSDLPVRLALPADWRVAIFALTLTFGVTLLFGLAPALRASSVKPSSTLKGGDDPHGKRRLMSGLIAAQVAFCSFVLFVAGLFIATFTRMANQPTGFSPERLLTLDCLSRSDLSSSRWHEVTQRLRSLPGIQSAALAQFALMSFNAQTDYVWANGHVPDGDWMHDTWFLGVSPEWFETMQLPLLQGGVFRWNDESPKVAVVNEKFAKRYFGRENPVGRTFEIARSAGWARSPGSKGKVSVRIVGVAGDARYETMRMPIPATAYVPFRALDSRSGRGYRATFLVRAKTPDPMSLSAMLRREIPAIDPEIRVVNIVAQQELVESQMIRERLLATLSLFFATVALILAAVGLYGVLNYIVLERRRELGIRIALGARGRNIVWRVTAEVFLMLIGGGMVGLALGAAFERYVAGMLYDVKAMDPTILAAPAFAILAAALLAAFPPVLHALRLDPSTLLRAE
jgi:putative ABC transport system permease protein